MGQHLYHCHIISHKYTFFSINEIQIKQIDISSNKSWMVSLTAKPSAGLSPLIASQPSNFIHKSHTNRAKKSGLAVPQKYCCCRLGAILLAQTRKLQPSPLCQNLMFVPNITPWLVQTFSQLINEIFGIYQYAILNALCYCKVYFC